MKTDSSSNKNSAFFTLFLISAGAVWFEIALTRYFAITKWSEYGYWVISLVMAGFALSGVFIAIFRDWFVDRSAFFLRYLPAILTVTAALGYYFTIINPFNPLELQNSVTWTNQLKYIGFYYLSLLPFYFLTGVYISLLFILNARQIGRVYAWDLAGAGLGSAAATLLMLAVPLKYLFPLVLLLPASAAVFSRVEGRAKAITAAALALLSGEALLLLGPQPSFNEFKAIYAPLNTPGAKMRSEILSPAGDYMLLENFTERLDTDVSNNNGLLGISGPPTSYGLYRDGTRIGALSKTAQPDVNYAAGTLGAGPYSLLRAPKVLLIGTSGGFRIGEALKLGAAHVQAVETDYALYQAVAKGMAPAHPFPKDNRVDLRRTGGIGAAREAASASIDLVDISADYLDSTSASESAFTAEAIREYLRILKPDGLVSIPVSIRDFPVYAHRTLATVREGLRLAGRSNASGHVIVYRSAWNVRILVSPTPFSTARIEAIRAFSHARSFDASYYPGVRIADVRANLYNDLPSVSFASGQVLSDTPDDAIAVDAQEVLSGKMPEASDAFRFDPITLDKPHFYAVLDLSQLSLILQRLEILPQAEVSGLVNIGVLSQALVIALIVLSVPVFAARRLAPTHLGPTGFVRSAIYFACLGLGYLSVEIYLIEKAALYLSDRITAFSIVLTTMLIFSGIGSALSDRLTQHTQKSVGAVAAVVLACLVLMGLGLDSLIQSSFALSIPLKILAVVVITAVPALVMGIPFPLGMAQVGNGGMLPWAWGLNGAFSVVATPVANLIVREFGYSRLLLLCGLFYLLVSITLPSKIDETKGLP